MAQNVENEFLKIIGERIRKSRKQVGISQEQLADIASLDRTYIGGIERGERNITILNLKKVADAIGIPLKDIVG
jgi:transcriptional regulator with XRE-family HTH domain